MSVSTVMVTGIVDLISPFADATVDLCFAGYGFECVLNAGQRGSQRVSVQYSMGDKVSKT